MLKNAGMYAYRQSEDRYGRGSSMRRFDCPVCGHHVFLEEERYPAVPGGPMCPVPGVGIEWTYSCVICTHVSTFCRQLEKMRDVTEQN